MYLNSNSTSYNSPIESRPGNPQIPTTFIVSPSTTGFTENQFQLTHFFPMKEVEVPSLPSLQPKETPNPFHPHTYIQHKHVQKTMATQTVIPRIKYLTIESLSFFLRPSCTSTCPPWIVTTSRPAGHSTMPCMRQSDRHTAVTTTTTTGTGTREGSFELFRDQQ